MQTAESKSGTAPESSTEAKVERLEVAPVSARNLTMMYWEDADAIVQRRFGLAVRR